jgi:hypothetical protein
VFDDIYILLYSLISRHNGDDAPQNLHNLAGTDYELPEDDAVASKHVGIM